MQSGGGETKGGLSVLPQMTRYQTTAFGIIGLYSQTVSLPSALYLCTDQIRGCIRPRACPCFCEGAVKNLKDVISQSFLIVSIAMHFHGGVIYSEQYALECNSWLSV